MQSSLTYGICDGESVLLRVGDVVMRGSGSAVKVSQNEEYTVRENMKE